MGRHRYARRVVRSEPGAYRFVVDDVELDLARFDALVAEAAATEHLDVRLGLRQRALALVRGEVLANEPYAVWTTPLRDLYAERHLQLLLDLAEDCLSAGAVGEAVVHAERVLTVQPARERAYRVLMAAHYAAGEHDIPCPVGAVTVMPLPHRLPRPELARQIPPRAPGPIPEHDPFQHLTPITQRLPRTPRRTRQERVRRSGPGSVLFAVGLVLVAFGGIVAGVFTWVVAAGLVYLCWIL